MQTCYRYQFAPSLPIDEVKETLHLAIVSTQNLHGEGQVKLDAQITFDAEERRCDIAAGTEVGRDLNQHFVGFLAKEFGQTEFTVKRNEPPRIHESN